MRSMNNNNERKKYYDDNIPQEERNDVEDEEVKEFARNTVKQFELEKAAGFTVDDIILEDILKKEKDALEEHNRDPRNTTQMQMFGSVEHNTLLFSFADRQGYIADEIISSNTPPEVTDRLEYHNDMESLSEKFVSEPDGLPLYRFPLDRYPSPDEQDQRSDNDSPELGDVSELVGGSDSDDPMGPKSEQETDLESSSDSKEQVIEQDNNNNGNYISNDNNNNYSNIGTDKASISEEVEAKAEQSTESSKRKRDDDDSDENNTSSGPSKRIDLEDYLMDPGSDLFDLAGE